MVHRAAWGGFLVAAFATLGVGASGVVDFWARPIGGHLVSISGIVGGPTALCLIGAVVALLLDWRPQVRALARWIGASTGLVLIGLSVTGFVGVLDLATTQHAHAPILSVLDASSDAVGYVTLLSMGAVLAVLARFAARECRD